VYCLHDSQRGTENAMTGKDGATSDAQKRFDTSLVILFLTAVSYSAAFTYQAAYLGQFGIPPEFAEVSIKELLLFVGAVGAGFFAIITFADAAMKLWPKSFPASVIPRTVGICVWLAITIILLGLRGAPLVSWLISLAFPTLIAFGEFVLPILTFRHLPTYAAKVEASVHTDTSGHGIGGTLVRLLGPTTFLAVFTAITTMLFADAEGIYQARTRDTFLVTTGDQPCVVIRQLSEGLLCATFSYRDKLLLGDYRFLKAEGTEFSLKHIGRLAAVEPQAHEWQPLPGVAAKPNSLPSKPDRNQAPAPIPTLKGAPVEQKPSPLKDVP
jgi:hypothetical protein